MRRIAIVLAAAGALTLAGASAASADVSGSASLHHRHHASMNLGGPYGITFHEADHNQADYSLSVDNDD
ncbi:hypothetical protein BIV57_22175 [Mangrovactinospora gilvigrisea]|uniref:Uncharacterized protein n=1 Tax=Mangrovactinospora gilvigrisea TaxID=1428644 RepID=A0A1J7C1A9_9ACTN|nr:hypothetical protein [Mangrovactinospora gilvigrisea]OIV35356.1 hypothetical protein BIV57_22175 [Mangrovactinospora gilvigrisea]